ncbi:peptidoglycan-binding protein, partial [Candidatus Wolfebacteria bacterium]|nr:peptidoglycan-binding protein [Candidatus Wolfebacteria bacterium]
MRRSILLASFLFVSSLAFGVASVEAHNINPNEEIPSVEGTTNALRLKNQVAPETVRQRVNVSNQSRVLVLLFQYQDSPATPFTKEQAHDMIFNGFSQRFFQEQSYGQMSLAGEVKGWFTETRNLSDGVNRCGRPTDQEISRAVQSENINIRDFDQLVLVSNNACVWGSAPGPTQMQINGETVQIGLVTMNSIVQSRRGHPDHTSFNGIVAHELLHNFLGFNHASFLNCGAQGISDNCRIIEYSSFDLFGVGNYLTTLNAFYKERIGWLHDADFQTITRSGRYTIKPINSTSGVRAAKIRMGGEEPYYLEFHRPTGMSINLAGPRLNYNTQGLFVHLAAQTREGLFADYLLNMNPDISPALLDQVTLNGSRVFEDRSRGVKIGPVISADDNGITFDVVFENSSAVGGCARSSPVARFFGPQTTNQTYFSVTFYLSNLDNVVCGRSVFQLGATLPSGWRIETPEVDRTFPISAGDSRPVGLGIRQEGSRNLYTYTGPGFEVPLTVKNVTANTQPVVVGIVTVGVSASESDRPLFGDGIPDFVGGDRMVATNNVNVRSLPSLNGHVVGVTRQGTFGVVTFGPQTADGYTWWRVRFDDTFGGWVVGRFLRNLSTALSGEIPPGENNPAITRVPVPSNALPQPNAALYRVRYTAPSTRDGTLRSAPLSYTVNNISIPYGVHVYAYRDAGFSEQAYGTQSIGSVAARNPTNGTGEISIPLVSEGRPILVPAGQTLYFELRGTVLATGDNAELRVKVPGLGEEVFRASFLPRQSMSDEVSTSTILYGIATSVSPVGHVELFDEQADRVSCVAPNNRDTRANRNAVSRLQRLLARYQCYSGSIDGLYDSETSAAMRTCQLRFGLPQEDVNGCYFGPR